MAPIKITVTDRSGEDNQEVVGDNDGFKAILDDLDARFLKDENGAKVRSFGGLVEGSSYTLGPPHHHHHQQQRDGDMIKRAVSEVLVDHFLKTRATPLQTPRAYGEATCKKARRWQKFDVFEPKEGSEAALDQATVQSLAHCTTEHQLVAKLTRHFEVIFESDACVVNSEEYKWLETGENAKFNQKPDMMLCDEAIYRERPAWNTQEPLPDRRESDKFGQLCDWALRDCLAATLEAKLLIDNQGVGETMNYGNHIVLGSNAPAAARLVLFDKTKFWLMEISLGENVSIIECRWTTPGSKHLLRNFPFYRNPWTSLLREACCRWDVTIARDPKGSTWLGYGTFGRVFRVKKKGADKHMALKLVLQGNAAQLSMEMSMMLEAAQKCDCVMPIATEHMIAPGGASEPDNCVIDDMGGAMLLSHVGNAVEGARYADVIRALAALHNKHIYHGDPRLANVTEYAGKLYWIDFLQGKQLVSGGLSQVAKGEDMVILVRSILNRTTLPSGVSAAVDSYNGNAQPVIDAVGSHFLS